MSTSNISLIPYGNSDFATLRREGKYYVDKTRFIRMLEEEGDYLFLLRPRRFGKSLMANMLAAYYDVNMAASYEELFSGLQIYANPTAGHNRYMILKFNFSGIDTSPDAVEESFNQRVLSVLKAFAKTYSEYLPDNARELMERETKGYQALQTLQSLVKGCAYPIYLIIDEYDNFANTLLSRSESSYRSLTHGAGFFRLFFNVLKELTTDNDAVVRKMFITGVTPLTLTDVTSGFNIGRNISMLPWFNEIVGFTESEVRTMLEYYESVIGIFQHSVEEILDYIKPWYNNSCFAPEALQSDRMFNSDMVLYFMSYLTKSGTYPNEMIDPNVVQDMDKIRMMLGYDSAPDIKGMIIEQILNAGCTTAHVSQSFRIEDIASANALVSLMYYLGLLTYGLDEDAYPVLTIPNKVISSQYYLYLGELYSKSLNWYSDNRILSEYAQQMLRGGDSIPMLEYITHKMAENSSNRDFNREGESFVKGFLLASLCSGNFFICETEREANHGYVDILLRPKAFWKHAFIIELKYLKHSSTDKQVEDIYVEAVSQLTSYAQSHPLIAEAEQRGWQIHRIALVVKGWELAKLKEIKIQSEN